jgi:uncharacterized protein YuzE
MDREVKWTASAWNKNSQEEPMRIEYDPEANALYIRFRDAKPADNIDVQDGLTIDLDDQKRLIGIEILDVSHCLPPDTLATITVQNLLTGTF